MASTATTAIRARVAVDARANEHRIRRAAGWLLNYAGIQVIVGVAWDSTWHYSVGRDSFLYVPSHMLLYTGTALAGIVCLAMILLDTFRYRRVDGVDDGATIAVLKVFHAPLGIVLGGFGVLTIFVAALLDDYWHTLYGAFLHVASPFHMMDVIGGVIFFLGSMYLWAALAVEAGRTGDDAARRRAEWGVLIAAVPMLRIMMALSNPGLSVYQTIDAGGLRFMTYPVVFALLTPWMLLAVAEAVRRPRAATTVALMLLLSEFAIQFFVPWTVRTQAAIEGRAFLSPALVPYFSLTRMAPDVLVLLAAVVIDLLRRRASRRGGRLSPAMLGLAAAIPLWIGGAILPMTSYLRAVLAHVPPGIGIGPLAELPDAFVALPLALGAGVLSGLVGYGLGQVLRLSRR